MLNTIGGGSRDRAPTRRADTAWIGAQLPIRGRARLSSKPTGVLARGAVPMLVPVAAFGQLADEPILLGDDDHGAVLFAIEQPPSMSHPTLIDEPVALPAISAIRRP